MSRPEFLADENFNEHIIRGVERVEPLVVCHRARHVGLSAQPDGDVLAWAAARSLIVLSHDVNTISAAASDRIVAVQPMPGVLLVRLAEPIARVIESIIMIWVATEAMEWQNQIVFLPL